MNNLSYLVDNIDFVIFATTLIGLLVGSFLNVVIHRVPLMMQNRWREECCELLEQPQPENTPLSLVYPNSRDRKSVV